jgi:hypothetical protein
MAIVSKRTLQRLIRENATLTSVAQRTKQAAALNRANVDSLSIEWEILVLNGLSRVASVKHEPAVGARFPDVLASVAAGEISECFVADITTVFDESSESANPIHALVEEVRHRAMKIGLSGNGFKIDARGSRQGQPWKQRMVLKVPAKRDFDCVFGEFLRPFLADCANAPKEYRERVVRTDSLDFTISYSPGLTGTGLSYPSYTTNYSVTHNTVFNALRGKAKQLRATEFDGPRGVILCGADANLARNQRSHGLEEIVTEFFRQNTSVTFVLALWVPQRAHGVMPYKSDLYENPVGTRRLGSGSRSALLKLHTQLPKPLEDGVNAVNQLKFWRWKKGKYFFGFRQETRHMVKISARVLMQYLAGEIDRQEFRDALHDANEVLPVFARRLKNGQLVTNIALCREPTEDDDWVVFQFGEPDPALAPIRPE